MEKKIRATVEPMGCLQDTGTKDEQECPVEGPSLILDTLEWMQSKYRHSALADGSKKCGLQIILLNRMCEYHIYLTLHFQQQSV